MLILPLHVTADKMETETKMKQLHSTPKNSSSVYEACFVVLCEASLFEPKRFLILSYRNPTPTPLKFQFSFILPFKPALPPWHFQ